MRYIIFCLFLFSCGKNCDKVISFENKSAHEVELYIVPDCYPTCSAAGNRIWIRIGALDTKEYAYDSDHIKLHCVFWGTREWIKTFDVTDCETLIILE